MGEEVRFQQAPKHWPILVSLCLLGLNQIRQRHDIDIQFIVESEGNATFPKRLKGRHPSQLGHDVNAHVHRLGVVATKVNGMTFFQVFGKERGDGNTLSLEIIEGRLKPIQVLKVGKNDKVDVSAELSRAIKHAGLTAHEQALNAMLPNRRKDFVNRVRGQGSLQAL
jgi:hypothetical protein